MTTTASLGDGLRVGELARTVGLSADTIRYYEKAGLLPPPARTASSYRVYNESSVDRLRFIQGAQRLGLRLTDIANLLEIRDTGVCPCESAELHLTRRLGEVDEEIARLQLLRQDMAAMLAALPSAECPPPTPGTWCPPGEGGDDCCDD